MGTHPQLGNLYDLYEQEGQPFRKVHRMIDLFESLIKFHTVVIMGEYFKRNQFSDSVKGLLAAGLRTPSLGTWQLFSRELYNELSQQEHVFCLAEFPHEFEALDKALNKPATNVIALRNRYAHGATPADEECLADIEQFDPFLTELLASDWLGHSTTLEQGEEVFLKAAPDQLLSLHPMMVYKPEEEAQPFVFFNDLKNKSVGLLNYALSKHYREKEFFSEFQDHIPVNEWRQTGNNEFAQRIEELTETFKGRLDEKKRIKTFIGDNTKGYLSIVGNPGIGKSALVARVFTELQHQSEESPVHITEYFIRRGTVHAQPRYLLEYLIKKTDSLFKEGRKIRPDGTTTWDLQQALFEKWRVYGEEEDKPKLVFVIDGLDEGIEQEVLTYLPRETFNNILIMYGSRPGGDTALDSFWGELPAEYHEKMHLGGLGRQDIRALLYEVANKYELQEEWIGELETRSQGNPLYLKLLCNSIESGSIEINNAESLPKQIEEYYKAIVDRYARLPDGDELLNSLFTFAAGRDYLTPDHIGEMNTMGPATRQRVMSTLAEVLVENPLTEQVLDYQLFHESFREYLVKTHAAEVRKAEQRIIDYCSRWESLTGWEQRYPLEHYGAHLDHLGGKQKLNQLLELARDTPYQTTQKRVLRGFEATKNLHRLAMNAGYELEDNDAVFTAALALVEVSHEESRDVQSILEMVRDYEIDLALERIAQFGDQTKDGYERTFKVYTICLIELTLCQTGNEEQRKKTTERLLEHMEQTTPINDLGTLNWSEFLPCHLLFKVNSQLQKWGISTYGILNRTSIAIDEDVLESGLFNKAEIIILLEEIENVDRVSKDHRIDAVCWMIAELNNSNKFKKQDSLFADLLSVVNKVETSKFKSVQLLIFSKKLAKHGLWFKAYRLLIQAKKTAQKLDDPEEKGVALREISATLYEFGFTEKASFFISRSLELHGNITKQPFSELEFADTLGELARQGEYKRAIQLSRSLNDSNKTFVINISMDHIAKNGDLKQALEIISIISDARIRTLMLLSGSDKFYKEGLKKEALQLLEKAIKLSDEHINNVSSKLPILISVIPLLIKLGFIERAINMTNQIPEASDKIKMLCNISNILINQESKTFANQVLEQAIALTDNNPDNNITDQALGSISVELATQGSPIRALEFVKSISNGYAKSKAIQGIVFSLIERDEIIKIDEVLKRKDLNRNIRKDHSFNILNKFSKKGFYNLAILHLEKTLNTDRFVSDFVFKTSLKNTASELALKGFVDQALLITNQIPSISKTDRIIYLCKNSSKLAKQEKGEAASQFLREAINSMSRLSDSSYDKSNALEYIAQQLSNQGYLDQALEISDQISDNEKKEKVLVEISTKHLEQSKLDQAFEIAENLSKNSQLNFLNAISNDRLNDKYFKRSKKIINEILKACTIKNIDNEKLFESISIFFAKQHYIDDALMIANKIDDIHTKGTVLCKIATEILKSGNKAEADKIMEKGLRLIEKVDAASSFDPISKFREVFYELIKQEQISKLLDIVNKNYVGLNKIEALKTIIILFLKTGDLVNVNHFIDPFFNTAAQLDYNRRNDVYKALFFGIQDFWFAVPSQISSKLELEQHFLFIIAKKITGDVHKENVIGFLGETCQMKDDINSIEKELVKLNSPKEQKYFLKGYVRAMLPSNADIKNVLSIIRFLKHDIKSLEYLLFIHSLHCLFLANTQKKKLQQFNRILDIQRAIDIADKLPNENATPKTSANVNEWINEIEDEFDREDIIGWAEKVRKGEMPEETFLDRIKRFGIT